MFESADPETRTINATDKRFFWIALYAQPVLWILLAVVALASLEFIWLTLVGESARAGGGKEGGWKRKWGRMEWKLTWNSHCPGPYPHQCARLLSL